MERGGKLKGRYDDPGFALFQRLIENPHDQRRNVVRYELTDGRLIEVDARAVKEHGLAEVMKAAGVTMSTERVAVIQRGKQIGTLPPTFDPLAYKSRSFLYDMRPGDFTRTDEGWVAAGNIGPGDFELIPGFVWEPNPSPSS